MGPMRWPSPLQSLSFLAIIPVFGLNDLLNHLPELDYSTHSSFYKIILLARYLLLMELLVLLFILVTDDREYCQSESPTFLFEWPM